MKVLILALAMILSMTVSAQERVTVEAQSYEVSDNLDLEAVAVVFGQSKNIEDFEKRLNDPENQLSNLDLNNDGYVDFLRVMEMREEGEHVVLIQAVIGEDLYQDVATIVVEGKSKKSATVTIVGNTNIYGDNYVIRPVFVTAPVIFDWFWMPVYAVYRSLYYWNYYPAYYSRLVCMGYHSYHRHIHRWHRHHYCCDFMRPVHYTNNYININIYNDYSRNDYVDVRPNAGYRKDMTPNRNLNSLRGSVTTGRGSGTLNKGGMRNGGVSTSGNIHRESNSTARHTGTAVNRGSSVGRGTSTPMQGMTTAPRSLKVTTMGGIVQRGGSTSTHRGTSTTVNRGTSVTRGGSTSMNRGNAGINMRTPDGVIVSRGTTVTRGTSTRSTDKGTSVTRGTSTSVTTSRALRPQTTTIYRGNTGSRKTTNTTLRTTNTTSRQTTYTRRGNNSGGSSKSVAPARRSTGGSRSAVKTSPTTVKKVDTPVRRR